MLLAALAVLAVPRLATAQTCSVTKVYGADTPTIPAGTTYTFRPTVTSTGSCTAADLAATWSVDGGAGNGTVAGGTLNQGVYTAPSTPGSYVVRVTSSRTAGVSDWYPVVVTAPPLCSVTKVYAADKPTIEAGTTYTFRPIVTSTGSCTAADLAATWSVDGGTGNGTVFGATLTEGVYTAPSFPGTYLVRVASSRTAGVSDWYPVVVIASTVQPCSVTKVYAADKPAIATGATYTFRPTVTSTGTCTAADLAATWSVDGGAANGTVVGAALNEGAFTAPSTPGNYVVRVASSRTAGVSDWYPVTVEAPPAPPPPPRVTPPAVVPAFPGAEGGGALSRGGRGGAVFPVTNLNDSGPGSLRACVEASGPRTCVFRVGGVITLSSTLRVTSPYLTVAGQTAPGGGIALSGKNLTSNVMTISGTAHDVVLRYLRFWKGYNAGTNVAVSGSNLHIEGASNVIVDHCSVNWTQSKSISIWRAVDREPRSITTQWSLLAEPLAAHPTLMVTGSETRTGADQTTDIDWHHNYFASGSHRNPLLKNKSTRWVNNLIYNWNTWAGETGGGAAVDVIGNVWRRGPMSTFTGREWLVFPAGNATTPNGTPSIYFSNNVTPTQGNALAASDLASWTTATGRVAAEGIATYQNAAVDTVYRRTSPMPAGTTLPITTTTLTGDGSNLIGVLLGPGGAGASQRLDCAGNWVSNRDAADTRIVGYFPGGGPSARVLDERDMGGFPAIAPGPACADADADGIPDAYEDAHGLNRNDARDAGVVQADGYTNLERYLNGQP